MSRIGKQPISIPNGVTVNLDGSSVTVKGPKGTLQQTVHPDMILKVDSGVVTVSRPSDDKQHRALHGLTRSLINNMVVGVTAGFTRELEINGVGYRAQKQGKTVTFNLGYSHTITVDENSDVKIDIPAPNKIIISGADKQKVGQLAAEIRAFRKPEPYHGMGIKYVEERIRRKAGKSGK